MRVRYRLFRAGIVLYLAALFGMSGRETGAGLGYADGALLGGGVGCVVGAAIALPLRAVVRAMVGALTGAILASIIAQSVTSSWTVTLVASGIGLLASGALTFFFPRPLLLVGFALFGAVAASVGVLSVATESVGGHIAYGPAQVAGVVLATALGVLYQSRFREKDDGN